MSDLQLFVQAQPFSLAGAGAILGATSITLTTFNKLNGTQLTMADFGSLGFGTLEPGSAENEEAITFSGVTANSNGTVTLTGVKHQLTESPYTQTSGLSKTHVGATTFIITNTAGFYDQLTSKDNDEIVSGKWTYLQSPDGPTPISASLAALATVEYVNNVALAGASKASVVTFGISRLSTAPVTASVPIAVGDNDTRVLTQPENDAAVGNSVAVAPSSSTNVFITQQGFQRNQENYAVATGTSTVLVLTLSPTPVALIAGQLINFKFPGSTGTAPTINVNSLGAKNLVKATSGGTTALVLGDIATNVVVLAEYDGGAFEVLSPVGGATYAAGVVADLVTTATANNDVSVALSFIPRFIKLRYFIQGYDGTGSTGYTGRKGVAMFSGTTLLYDDRLFNAAQQGDILNGDNGQPSGIAQIQNIPNATTSLVTPTGTGAVTTTLTILSVTSSGFTIRRATVGDASHNNRAKIAYEAFA